MKAYQLEAMIQDLVDGCITQEDFDELSGKLKSNPEAMSLYLEYVDIANIATLDAQEKSHFTPVVPIQQVIRRQEQRSLKIAVLAAAAVLLMALTVMRLFFVDVSNPAMLSVGFSSGAEFTISHDSFREKEVPEGMVLEPGSRLVLSYGTAELTFRSGVKATVIAPADLTLHGENKLFLSQGNAWFSVPPEAVGFQVKSHDLDIVDLGTEFGVLADPNDHDEVHVIKGRVRVSAKRVRKESRVLSANEACRADPVGRLITIPSHWPKVLPTTNRWPVTKTKEWYAKLPWLIGCTYIPSNAVNQLEMWQADTWSPQLIDRELQLAEDTEFNMIRVYLHDLAFKQDPEGFLERMDQFLALAKNHDLKVIFVIFDDSWLDQPRAGKQPAPLPGVHNSGWLQSPGFTALERYTEDVALRDRLKKYVTSVLNRFKDDERVLIWDLYNQPGQRPHYRDDIHGANKRSSKRSAFEPLLYDAYVWARSVSPSQPLTSMIWHPEFGTEAALDWADVSSFLDNSGSSGISSWLERLKGHKRPIFSTECIARPGATFDGCLTLLRRNKVATVSWGLVAGKTNTIYPWGSWNGQANASEPKVWLQDLYRQDGSPYDAHEIDLIRNHVLLSQSQRQYLITPATTSPAEWLYSMVAPSENWNQMAYDDSSWKNGLGGFGAEGAPRAHIGTFWSGDETSIWLRKKFIFDEGLSGKLFMEIYHDDSAVVYLNGVQIYQANDYQTEYKLVDLSRYQHLLKSGDNLLSIRCDDDLYGQYIDVGLGLMKEENKTNQ